MLVDWEYVSMLEGEIEGITRGMPPSDCVGDSTF